MTGMYHLILMVFLMAIYVVRHLPYSLAQQVLSGLELLFFMTLEVLFQVI